MGKGERVKAKRLKDELSSEADCGLFGFETACLISSRRPQALVRPSASENLGSATRSVQALEWVCVCVCGNCEWRWRRMCWTLITVAVRTQGHALRWSGRTLQLACTLSRPQHPGSLAETNPKTLLTGHSTRTETEKTVFNWVRSDANLESRIKMRVHSRIWLKHEHTSVLVSKAFSCEGQLLGKAAQRNYEFWLHRKLDTTT